MRKKLLSLALTLAMLATCFAGFTVASFANEADPYFTVYVTDKAMGSDVTSDDLTEVKSYTVEELKALKATDGNVVARSFFKLGKGNNWFTMASNDYAYVKDIVADTGITGYEEMGVWTDSIYQHYTGYDFSKWEKEPTYLVKDILDNGGITKGGEAVDSAAKDWENWTFPENTTSPGEIPTAGQDAMEGIAFAFTAGQGSVSKTDGKTSGDAIEANKATATTSKVIIVGNASENDFSGKECAQGVNGIVLNNVKYSDWMTAKLAMDALDLDNLTAKNEAAIKKVLKMVNNLTDADRAKLDAASIEKLVAAKDAIAADKAEAKKVFTAETAIDAIGTVNYTKVSKIKTAREAYDAVGEDAEYLVDNSDVLFAAETLIAKIPTAKPGKFAAVNKSGKKVKASWSGVKNAEGYKVYYKKSTSSKWTCKTTSSKSFTVAKLTKNAKYSFKVRAYAKVDGKTYYGPYTAVKTVKVAK